MAAITVPHRRPRLPRSLLSKIPYGLLAAAALISAVGALSGAPTAEPGPVAAAIEAPFVDVGIMPVEDAVDFWRARVDERPADYASRTRLATTIVALAKETGSLTLYDEAEQVLRESLALNPIDEATLLALGSVRAANHDFAGAIELATSVLERKPGSQAAQVAIADANFELGNYELASRQLEALVLELPEGAGVDSRLAKRAAVEGRIDDAINLSAGALLAASDLDLRASEAAFYRFQLGHFLHQAGRADQALEVLDAGLSIDPTHLASLEAKAHVLVSLGRLDAAAATYEQLIERGPAADLHGELAKIYRALGRDRAAEAQVAEGLRLGREQISAFPAERRHLASFFAEFEPATALDLAKADFATRKDVGAYDTLAWAHYRNGQYEQAARYVDGALAQGTRDATLLYHAGMIELAVGDTDEGAQHLRDALEINPRFDLVHAPRAIAALRGL
ncbi:MAG: tetratricopeptide repeat protein [Actinomycetota bacterium]